MSQFIELRNLNPDPDPKKSNLFLLGFVGSEKITHRYINKNGKTVEEGSIVTFPSRSPIEILDSYASLMTRLNGKPSQDVR